VLAEVNASRLEELPEPLREGLEVLAATRGNRRDVALIGSHPPLGEGAKR
jgi:hypothetical protein